MFWELWIAYIMLLDVCICGQEVELVLTDWLYISDISFNWEFTFDSISSIMIFVIISVSFCVHMYSMEYMGGDPHLARFLAYLSFFTFCMLFVVTGGNYFVVFVGWEGVGIASYLLINFWYTRIAANKSAMKAMIINKIGDVCLILGFIYVIIIASSLDIVVVNTMVWLLSEKMLYWNVLVYYLGINYLNIILLLFIVGVCAKSAQIGLHTWLPDAMEGPTPVSALIHAATMVTAGVFLLLRSANILKYSDFSLLLISVLGAITSFVAASIGLFQNDIKKIIAYSTCSQLGYMVLSCGLNNYSGSLFHLMNHAFFKALLFLSAGAIIHSMIDLQDIRRMGMLLRYLPVSYLMILIGSLAIMGIPFLTGFYSKDFLLECVFSSNIFLTSFLYWLGTISAALTSFYSIKLLFLTFYNVHNSYFNILYNRKNKLIFIHESGSLILTALIILFFGSVFIGYLFKEVFIGMGTDVWTNTLDTESYKTNLKIFEVEFLPIRIKLIPVIFTLISALLSFIFFKFYIFIIEYLYIFYFYIQKLNINKSNTNNFKKFITIIFNIKKLIFNGYYFNEIYNYYLYKNKKLSSNLMKNLDKGLIEYLSHLLIVNTINKLLVLFSKKHANRIDYLVFIIILGVIIISTIVVLWYMLSNYKILGLLFILIFFNLNLKGNKV